MSAQFVTLSRPPQMGGWTRRAIDVAVVIALAPAVLLFVVVIAIATKLDTRGPVFFRDRRLGHGERPMRVVKFRTMVVNAEELKPSLQHLSILPLPDFKIPNDPRITRVGRWLRHTSMDELPQFWNVLVGDLTLVGPRPSRIPIDQYELWQTERLEARPGIFGKWQCEGRARVNFDDRCRMDIRQVRERSVRTQIGFAWRTLGAVLLGKGAA